MLNKADWGWCKICSSPYFFFFKKVLIINFSHGTLIRDKKIIGEGSNGNRYAKCD